MNLKSNPRWRKNSRLQSPGLMLRAMLPLVLLLSGTTAKAQQLPADVQWKDPSSVKLQVEFPGDGYHASWDLFRCTCGDLLIRSELSEPGEVAHGDILLVSNRVVLSRGYEEGDEELLSYDAPALMMQLALRLVERAEPKGPAAVTGKQQADVTDEINHINLDTGTAVGGFPPPWSVKGTLSPDGPTRRRFDVQFNFNTGGAAGGADQQGAMRLKGVGEYAASEFPVTDDLDLGPWLVKWRDENDPARGAGSAVKTLGELRKVLKDAPPAVAN
jgi:hypothetical protein